MNNRSQVADWVEGLSRRRDAVVRPSAGGMFARAGEQSVEPGERHDVPIAIDEPCNAIAARCGPHSLSVLLHALVAHEYDAAGFKSCNGLADVSDMPAERRITGVCDVGHRGKAQHRAVGVEHTGMRVLVYDGEPQGGFVGMTVIWPSPSWERKQSRRSWQARGPPFVADTDGHFSVSQERRRA